MAAVTEQGNPNSNDLPREDQQVMSSPNRAGASGEQTGPRTSMTNGVAGGSRGPLDLDDEVSMNPGLAGSQSGTSGPSTSTTRPVDQVTTSREGTGHFLSSTLAGLMDGRNGLGNRNTSMGGPPEADAMEREESRGNEPGSFFNGVMRGLAGVSATRNDVPPRPPPAPQPGPKVSTQEVDGYLSANSVSPGDPRPPSTEPCIPPTPLFDQRTWDRLSGTQADAPHLYRQDGAQASAGRASSTPSSDIQAEVRRQLSEYMAMHEEESSRLRRQVEALAYENRELRIRAERAHVKESSHGFEGPGFSGLGWLGRGLGSFLSGSKASPSQPSVDLGFQRAMSPPRLPPPPTASLDFSSGGQPVRDPDPRVSPGVPTPRHELPVQRTLQFDSLPSVPIAAAKPPVASSTANPQAQATSLDPLSVVLTGMAQLQGVVSELASTPKAGGKSEVIKPGVAALPELPHPGTEACLEFSDWLHNSRPALADVSDTSEELWELVVQEAGVWYSEYLRRSPLERLTMKPSPSATLLQVKWARVSRRIETMVIACAPAPIRDELSAARVSGLMPVLCRLYTIYAPGGLSEREIGLRQLQDPPVANGVKEAVSLLRKWQRWGMRMRELGGVLPDSALRVKALEKITKQVLLSYPDIGFRINLTRAALQIDTVPDDAKVDQLHAQLLTELETVSHRATKDSDRSRDQGPGVTPKVKGVENFTRATRRWAEPGLVRVKQGGKGSLLTLPPSPLWDGEVSKPSPTSGDASEESSTIGTDRLSSPAYGSYAVKQLRESPHPSLLQLQGTVGETTHPED